MSYILQSKSDISSGVTLVVRMPEMDVDKKALYTILADSPNFILPFRYKTVDGDIELTYQVGARNNLKYYHGVRNTKDYIALWTNVLSPFLECGDWFMKPFSFVLQTSYLYFDRSAGSISYVYIPSISAHSDNSHLNQMIAEISKICSSDNHELEIMVLRSIMEGFNPKEFLNMLRSYQKPESPQTPATPEPVCHQAPASPQQTPQMQQPQTLHQPVSQPAPIQTQNASGASDDIVINLRSEKPKPKEKPKDKPKGGLFGAKPEKKETPKPASQPKPKGGGLFAKKNVEPKDAKPLIMGAAAEPPYPPPISFPREEFAYNEGTVIDEAEATVVEKPNAKLRLVSTAPLPREIIINKNLGRPFIIGRQQSDFEFEKTTKAVSRQHAAIEFNGNTYLILDLSSTAGTFINGQKIQPNVPYELTFGIRVSFGTAGADYVFEG